VSYAHSRVLKLVVWLLLVTGALINCDKVSPTLDQNAPSRAATLTPETLSPKELVRTLRRNQFRIFFQCKDEHSGILKLHLKVSPKGELQETTATRVWAASHPLNGTKATCFKSAFELMDFSPSKNGYDGSFAIRFYKEGRWIRLAGEQQS